MSGTLHRILFGATDATDVAKGESATEAGRSATRRNYVAKPVAFKRFLSTVSTVGISPALLDESVPIFALPYSARFVFPS